MFSSHCNHPILCCNVISIVIHPDFVFCLNRILFTLTIDPMLVKNISNQCKTSFIFFKYSFMTELFII